MRHLDITFDLETCAVTANAAVMQVAAVAWTRNADGDPFSFEHDGVAFERDIVFNEHVDLRTCVVDGFDFEPATVQWWTRQSEAARQAVCDGLAEPVKEVFARFIQWIEEVMKITGAKSVCLWCQGMDFDGAILYNVCRKYGLKLPFRHQQLRDSRTVILEAAVIQAQRNKGADGSVSRGASVPSPDEILADDRMAYSLYPQLPGRFLQGEAHDALYDAIRSSWNTWQALRWMSGK